MLFKVEGEKLNWIDINDIYVGYDTSTSCCEDADWFVAFHPVVDSKELNIFTYSEQSDRDDIDWAAYDFDPSYGKSYGGVLDDGGVAIFRLVHKEGADDLYLHLYNAHNGYYGHGFDSNTVLGDGCL